VIFEDAARPILVAHGLVGLAAVASTGCHAACSLLTAMDRPEPRALRRTGATAAWVLIAQMLLGLALYPTYRVRVRAADFDRTAPVFSQLFDFKEHLAALSLILVLAAVVAARQSSREERWSVAALSCTGATLVWVAATLGLWVTLRHPV
jgi:hypothetical protein